jgi:dihydropteroate synthase
MLSIQKPQVMGILNVTPDSFSGDGLFCSKDYVHLALLQVEKFLQDGADWIDIGAESTRPGAKFVSEQEELDRMLPVVEVIRKNFPNAKLSIDTTKSKVAEKTLALGAHMINDVSGGTRDPDMLCVMGQYQAPFIVMHSKDHIHNDSSFAEDRGDLEKYFENFLEEIKTLIDAALKKNIPKIIVDPGIGFGKTLSQNLFLIANIQELKNLGHPVLMGVSRKSFIGKVTGKTCDKRLGGSLATALFTGINGADFLRVHDVLETRQMIDIWWEIFAHRK